MCCHCALLVSCFNSANYCLTSCVSVFVVCVGLFGCYTHCFLLSSLLSLSSLCSCVCIVCFVLMSVVFLCCFHVVSLLALFLCVSLCLLLWCGVVWCVGGWVIIENKKDLKVKGAGFVLVFVSCCPCLW